MYRGDGAYIRTKYDSNNLTTSAEYKFGGVTEKTTYEYQADKDNAPYKASFTNGSSSVIEYDGLGRAYRTAVLSSPGHFLFMTEYSYLNNPSDANKTSGVVSKIAYNNNLGSFSYKYDSRGNITEETLSNVTVNSYHYDSLNRLTRVDSEAEGNTHIYTYDGSGNILSDKVYTCYLNSEPLANKTLIKTINYTYGDSDWGDKLTAYNGKAITYDDIGNPLTYDGQSFTWLGRRMMSYTGGGVTANYKYNSDGIRITKTVGGTTTTFFLNNSTILAQKTGNTVIPFYYNAAGDRVGFKYNGEMYFYVKNLQGDVVKIVNSSKAVVGEYKYDSWGKILNLDSLTDIAKANPFRYRGYYYDTESNLYYLNSRYYNPEWGRFISSDSVLDNRGVNTQNLFAYCGNNPVINQDPNGHFFFGALIGGIIGGASGAFCAYVSGKSVVAGFVTGAVTGAAIGGICDVVATGGMSAVVGVALCGAAATTGNIANQVWNYSKEKKDQTRDNYSVNTKKKNQSNKKIPTSTNGKYASECSSVFEYIDYKSVAVSCVATMAFTPASIGANCIVNSAFVGCETSGITGFVAQFVANFALGGNLSILQSIIDLF